MKKSIKALLVITMSISVLVGVTGCGKKQNTLPAQGVTKEEIAAVQTKDDSGKELSEAERAIIAAMRKDSAQLENISREVISSLYDITPENVEQQMKKSNQYCLDQSKGLYGDQLSEIVKGLKDSKETDSVVSWVVTEVKHGLEVTINDKKYNLVGLKGTLTYDSSTEGKGITRTCTFGFVLNEKDNSWKIVSFEATK